MIALDSETALTVPGVAAPPLACVTYCRPDEAPGTLSAADGLDAVEQWLSAGELIVTANGAYDFGVFVAARPRLLVPTFNAYRDGQIRCVQIRQKLLDIASGDYKYQLDAEGEVVKSEYSLAALAKRHLGISLEKGGKFNLTYEQFAHLPPDQWLAEGMRLARESDQYIRLRFGDLIGTPLSDWPAEAVEYAQKDAALTLAVYRKQPAEVVNELEIAREGWAMQLMRIWGIRTNAESVAALKAKLEGESETLRQGLTGTGFFRERGARNPKSKRGLPYPESQVGTKDMAAIKARIVQAFEGRRIPMTDGDPPTVCTDAETKTLSGDPQLRSLGEIEKLEKVLTSFVPLLQLGTLAPICAEWNPIVETLRSSCRKPALQTPPRKGGVRECFEARKGVPLSNLGLAAEGTTDMVFLSSDYDTAELRSLAQKIEELGIHSELAAALRAGQDPHIIFAAELRASTYEETLALYLAGDSQANDDRQLAKIPNFGYPGGMGDATLVGYARGSGVNLCEARKVRAVCKGQACGETREGLEDWANPGCRTVATELGRIYRKINPGVLKYFEWIKAQLGGRDRAQFYDPVTRHTRVCNFTNAANGFFQTRTARGAKEGFWRACYEAYCVPESALYGSRPVIFLHDEIFLETPVARAGAAATRLKEIMLASMSEMVPNIPVKTEPKLHYIWSKKAKSVYRDGELVPWVPS